MTDNVVMFSGGVGSWATARRVADRYGADNLTLLVADTNSEADDWYSFIKACHADIGGELVILDNDGQTIWDVFKKERFIGNTRVDVCSKNLKRKPLRKWLEENRDPANTIIYLGFDWTEEHRLDRARPYWDDWQIEAPLCEPPKLLKQDHLNTLLERGIPIPKLYTAGFPHNNCAGACVKGGQVEWRRLLYSDRETFIAAEDHEQDLRNYLDKDVAILRDRRRTGTGRGVDDTKPLTLRDFRVDLERDPSLFDIEDERGCASCF